MQALLDSLKLGSPEWILANSLDPARVPAHIGVIMDGNGRWANSRSLPRVAGHRAGVEPVRITVETCAQIGVGSLTLYAFSVENWKRPRTEIETLWKLLRYYLRHELTRLVRNNIQLRAIGRLDALSVPVRRELDSSIAATSGNTGMILNLAINYGGRSEIVDAVNALIAEARAEDRLDTLKIDEESVGRKLYTAGQPELDLLIRTSGEMRVSNFLLWQIAYAELYITETYWPDFNRTALLEAMVAYQKRERRFGGIRTEPRAAADESWLETVSLPHAMKRILTGLIITPFFFFTILSAPDWFFLATLAGVALCCFYEYMGIAAAHIPGLESDPRRNPAGYLAGLFLLILPQGEALYLTLFALLLWFLVLRSKNLAHILPLAAMTIFGVIYVFGSWRCGVGLRAMSPWWMLFAVANNWVGDTFAFYFGKNFGKHKLAPVVSPGKSWEGAIASLISTIGLGVWFLSWKFPQVGVGQAVLLCALANVAGQAGDLCESAIKRGAGVKDSGNLLPGHGGWLDRVDSSLFSVPVVYWLLQQRWILP